MIDSTLGVVLRDQGKYAAADSIYRNVLDLRREKLEPDHPRMANTHRGLGRSLQRQQRYDTAERHLLEALRIRRSTHPEDHPDVRESRRDLVELYDARGRPERAAQYRPGADTRNAQTDAASENR